MAVVRDRGLAIYIKTEDGAPERASLPVLGLLLNKLGAITPETDKAIENFTRPVVKNWKKATVGKVEVAGLNL